MIIPIPITAEDFEHLRDLMAETDTEVEKVFNIYLKESDVTLRFCIVCPTCLDRKEVATDPTGQDVISCPDCKKERFEE